MKEEGESALDKLRILNIQRQQHIKEYYSHMAAENNQSNSKGTIHRNDSLIIKREDGVSEDYIAGGSS